MKRWMIPLWLAVAVLFGSAPLGAQTLLKGSITDFLGQVKKAKRQIDRAHDKAVRVYEGCMARTTTPEDPAYGALAQSLEKVREAYAPANEAGAASLAAGDKLLALFGSSRTIRSEDERYQEAKALLKEMQDSAKQLQGKGNAMNSPLKKYTMVANDAGIWELGQKKLNREAGKTAQRMELVRSKYRALGKMELDGINLESYQGLGALVRSAEEAWADHEQMLAEFKASPLGKQRFIYGGPGIRSFEIYQELKVPAKKIDKVLKQLKGEFIRIAGKSAWKEEEPPEGDDEDEDD